MIETLTITPDMVGKYVRLRNGGKAYCAAILPENVEDTYQVILQIVEFPEDGFPQQYTDGWCLNGKFIEDDDDSQEDIIGLWVDEDAEEEALKMEAKGDALGQAAINYRLYKIEKRLDKLEELSQNPVIADFIREKK